MAGIGSSTRLVRNVERLFRTRHITIVSNTCEERHSLGFRVYLGREYELGGFERKLQAHKAHPVVGPDRCACYAPSMQVGLIGSAVPRLYSS